MVSYTASYTADDANRVAAQDMTEVYAYYARLAAARRPDTLRATARLTGAASPADADTGPEVEDDSDQGTELDHEVDSE